MAHPKHTNTINKYFKAGLDAADWYDETRAAVTRAVGEQWAAVYIDMLAATSPNQSVKGNVTAANKALRQLKEGRPFAGYLPVVKSMLDIIRINWLTGYRVKFGGAKVQNFADALGGDLSAIVVDRWMLRAFGYPENITAKRYREISHWIAAKAHREGMAPAQVQAAIWCGIKRLEDTTGFRIDPIDKYLEV
jgi:hypothetical protein